MNRFDQFFKEPNWKDRAEKAEAKLKAVRDEIYEGDVHKKDSKTVSRIKAILEQK